MSKAQAKLTPVEIIRAIENLTPDELETLFIMLDRELAGELLLRREEAKEEFRKDELRTKEEIFKD